MQLYSRDPIIPPHYGNTYSRLLTTSGEVCKTPQSWLGKTVRFYADGGDFKLSFHSTSDLSIGVNAASTRDGSTLELVPAATHAPLTLKDWSFIDVYVSGDDLYFCIRGSNTTGYWSGHATSKIQIAR